MKNILFLLLLPISSFGQKKDDTPIFNKEEQSFKVSEEVTHIYSKPKVLDFFTKIPRNVGQLGKETVKKENLYPIALLLGHAVGSISANRRIKKAISTETSKSKHKFDTRLTFSNYYGTNLSGVAVSFK